MLLKITSCSLRWMPGCRRRFTSLCEIGVRSFRYFSLDGPLDGKLCYIVLAAVTILHNASPPETFLPLMFQTRYPVNCFGGNCRQVEGLLGPSRTVKRKFSRADIYRSFTKAKAEPVNWSPPSCCSN